MSFYTDFKAHVEAATSLNAYPYSLPQGVVLPVIMYNPNSFSRNGDSSLNDSNLIDRRLQIFIISKSPKFTLETSEFVENLYEGFSGLIGATTIFIARVQSSVPIFNPTQKTYEHNVDVIFTIQK